MNELFVSYARKNIKIVDLIIQSLISRGIDPWIDRTRIPPAADWRQACLKGVERCNSLLFILSPLSAISPPCAMELEYALEHDKRIIPMLIEPVPVSVAIHPALSRLNWLRFDLDNQKALNQLFDLLDSPLGSILGLADRPSAILEILYPDGERIQRALYQDCYWGGRNPNPPNNVAGKIYLKSSSAHSLISIVHFFLVVSSGRWVAMDASKNGGLVYSKGRRLKLPPFPPGWILTNGDKLEFFGNILTYREVQPKTNSDLIESAEFVTFPGFED